MNRRYRPLLTLLAIAAAAAFYWEFVRDIDPGEALAYYQQQPRLADADNGAFAFAGIAAPEQAPDPAAWGYVEIQKNRDRYRRGELRITLLGDRAADDRRLFLQLPAEGRHLACWMPTGGDARSAPGCLEREDMLALLAQNRLLLERYRKVFDFDGLYFRKQDRIGFTHAHRLSRMLAIDLWLRRESLEPDDVETLFGFFRFWERQARDTSLSLVGATMSIVNYDIAATLLSRMSELDPGLLARYRGRHGDFDDAGFGADNFDRLVRSDFRSMNLEFCFSPLLGDETESCEARGGNLYYKPGRTVRLLYDLRLRPGHCAPGERARQVNTEAVDSDFWTYLFSRPGNFRGRGIARLASGAMRKVCVLLDTVDAHAEQNRLRNLYLLFTDKGYDGAQIETYLQDFMRSYRDRGGQSGFAWHAETGELVWQAASGIQRYRLAYGR